ncbi:hypothetical protein RCL_jg26272.t1 [Rhizophagus clarus]|uniref:Uncharacterized protein n=1 Tax=Rhizophagus clarus TaxID=94130 RepID=A0A8H3KYR8_9GLOM|nr:hypothetical protein RCL_jg26272.t1 [Rhizophagus clarus]
MAIQMITKPHYCIYQKTCCLCKRLLTTPRCSRKSAGARGESKSLSLTKKMKREQEEVLYKPTSNRNI